MDRAFTLGLLYLLVIIPQHGNSPIPRIESWMEMDQGDGFVDKDLTSSLTGAESFGSAHKNYQKALIRKKQANVEDKFLYGGEMGKFSGRVPDPVQRRAAITPNFMQNQYASYGYDNFVAGNVPNRRISQEPVSGINSYQGGKCRMQPSNGNGLATNSRLYGFRRTDLVDSPLTATNERSLQADNENVAFEDKAGALRDRIAKFDTEDASLNREEGADDSEYASANDETMNRVKSGSSEDYLTGIPMEGGDSFRFHDDEDEDVAAEDSDYYGDVRNPASARDDTPDRLDLEYPQINEERVIYKREETKTRGENSPVDGGSSRGSLKGDANLKSGKELRSDNLLRAEAPKESREITNNDGNGKLFNSNAMWTINSNLGSKDVEKALRNSRMPLEEMRIFRRKSEGKPEYRRDNLQWKHDNYGRGKKRTVPEEKRNKREDEDEQKNMKTGTDEGGGEYEDEEGKGHNDEEEYYEEGEISRGEIKGDTGTRYRSDSHSNRNLYKRETGKDEEEKGRKEHDGDVDVSLEEYQLNVENAPVEHENFKKSSWRQGKTREKCVSRRGMKIWDEWGKWSPCSVTCGVGRKTRWRHCIGGGCARGEKEALIKKCTYPAC